MAFLPHSTVGVFRAFGLVVAVIGLTGCKKEKEPPRKARADSTDVSPSTTKAKPTSNPSGTSKANQPASTKPQPAGDFSKSSSVASPITAANPTNPASPPFSAGTSDRDGDVSLVGLAKSLTTALNQVNDSFAKQDDQAAFAEAIRARQSIPSPTKVAAMGNAAGPQGQLVASRIESMRTRLDQTLERLDDAGVGEASSSMLQNVVIE